MKKVKKYYDFEPVNKIWKKEKAQYIMVFGERGPGKTYCAKKLALEQFIESGYQTQSVYIRRWELDLKMSKGAEFFDDIVKNDLINELTNGEYTCIYGRANEYYLANYDEDKDKVIPMAIPFMKTLALSQSQHHKSRSFPNVELVIFDEFLTRGTYLTNEFKTFTEMVSTVVRDRATVKIVMFGNTVNRHSPYFREMGLNKVIRNMKPGTIEMHTSKKKTKVVIEYTPTPGTNATIKKPSDIYFGFDNPGMKMITDGDWEVDIYPHLNFEYYDHEIKYFYHIIWEEEVIRCDIIKKHGTIFSYMHLTEYEVDDIIKYNEDTGEIYIEKLDNKHRVYHTEQLIFPNWHCNIVKERSDRIGTVITDQFKKYKVFYDDNSTGQTIDNYIKWCTMN